MFLLNSDPIFFKLKGVKLIIVGGSMKNAFVTRSLDYLIKNNACTEKQKNIFRYTLESLYSLVTKTTAVLILSIFLKTFPITCLMLLLYSLLRGFAFGLHATKNLYCWFITLSTYVFIPLFIKYLTIPLEIIYGLFGVGLIAMLLWAPADTPSRPLLSKKKRQTNKIITLFISVIYVLSAFYFNNANYYEIVLFVFMIETICICPITYKLFHIPYNNYKNYKK